jgi:hypothetical protein
LRDEGRLSASDAEMPGDMKQMLAISERAIANAEASTQPTTAPAATTATPVP